MKVLKKTSHLRGTITVPGDKSITHRAIMLGSLAKGTTRIRNYLNSLDCISTIRCFETVGIHIEKDGSDLYVHGNGLHGLTAPVKTLDAGNSGTTMRLMAGILAGQTFDSRLSGDASLNRRPMQRIIDPVNAMGGHIVGEQDNCCAPLIIHGRPLHSVHYHTPVASAQVKSCILLAGLYADGKTVVTEPAVSRNHTERMLRSFGADINSYHSTCEITPPAQLFAQDILIPGDISSAAYFIAAGLITPHSEILIRNVGINPTRAGFLHICLAMDADITLMNRNDQGGEPTADILVRSSSLKAAVIEGDIIPTLIDELPLVALLACFAKGRTIIRDAAELRVKESDRIELITCNLKAMGAEITEIPDGLIIEGGRPLCGCTIRTDGDHRIAMTGAIAGLAADGSTVIPDSSCVNISCPGFFETLTYLQS